MARIRNQPPPNDGPSHKPAAQKQPDLRSRVRPGEGDLNAQAERLASALRDVRSELNDTYPSDIADKQYQALVSGLQQPPAKPTPRSVSRPAVPELQVDAKQHAPVDAGHKRSASGRLLRALNLRGSLKGVLRNKFSSGSPRTSTTQSPRSDSDSSTRSDARSMPAGTQAPVERDPLVQVGDALRAKVRAQVAQALDTPTPDGLREALQAMLLFESPRADRACDLRHRWLVAELQAEPVRRDVLYEAVHDFVHNNPKVSAFDYAVFENAPVLYTACAGRKDRAKTLAVFFAQVCAAQFCEDEFLDDDPKLEAVDRLCETNEACLAYFAEGKRSVRLVVLSAAGLTRQLMRKAEKLGVTA